MKIITTKNKKLFKMAAWRRVPQWGVAKLSHGNARWCALLLLVILLPGCPPPDMELLGGADWDVGEEEKFRLSAKFIKFIPGPCMSTIGHLRGKMLKMRYTWCQTCSWTWDVTLLDRIQGFTIERGTTFCNSIPRNNWHCVQRGWSCHRRARAIGVYPFSGNTSPMAKQGNYLLKRDNSQFIAAYNSIAASLGLEPIKSTNRHTLANVTLITNCQMVLRHPPNICLTCTVKTTYHFFPLMQDPELSGTRLGYNVQFCLPDTPGGLVVDCKTPIRPPRVKPNPDASVYMVTEIYCRGDTSRGEILTHGTTIKLRNINANARRVILDSAYPYSPPPIIGPITRVLWPAELCPPCPQPQSNTIESAVVGGKRQGLALHQEPTCGWPRKPGTRELATFLAIFDQDENGYVDLSEFISTANKFLKRTISSDEEEFLREIWEQLDIDGDGLYTPYDMHLHADEVFANLMLFDTNGDGKIHEDEVVQVLDLLESMIQDEEDADERIAIYTELYSHYNAIPDDAIDCSDMLELYRRWPLLGDFNGDGEVDFQEAARVFSASHASPPLSDSELANLRITDVSEINSSILRHVQRSYVAGRMLKQRLELAEERGASK